MRQQQKLVTQITFFEQKINKLYGGSMSRKVKTSIYWVVTKGMRYLKKILASSFAKVAQLYFYGVNKSILSYVHP